MPRVRMSERDELRRVREYGVLLGSILNRLLVLEAGLPRPVISMQNTLPLLLPVDQTVVYEIRQVARDHHPPMEMPELHFIVRQDPVLEPTREFVAKYPYDELTRGQVLNDPRTESRPLKLVTLLLRDIPDSWRANVPLVLAMVAISRHQRHPSHWVARGEAKLVMLRVPRTEREKGPPSV
jgi:hypothetical protein